MTATRLDETLDDSEITGQKPGPETLPVPYRFRPGNSGRPKGSRNKLGEDFIAALAEDFAKHGMKAI